MRKIFITILSTVIFWQASSQKIRGIITNKEGELIPFASIFVKGSNAGTNSNNEGQYSLKLNPGNYVLVCQHVGYRKEEVSVRLESNDLEVNFILVQQEMMLDEVVLNQKEDPAYQIIRNAIRKREYYQEQYESFTCEVYTKGQLRLRDYPRRVLGQKVEFPDGDTSKKRMLYLSETISTYAVDGKNKEKIEVLSSRVSGQREGFGLSAPRFYSFYRDNILIGENLNPRGFISPIAGNALNFYQYRLEGTYFEDGREINHIRVTPRRKFEPLFSGHIDIVAEEWRIHSLKLQLTQTSQMELVDTLRLEQLYRPIDQQNWFISSQVIYPAIRMLGFDVHGSFVNIYSRINMSPGFGKKDFGSTVLKYLDSSNRKSPDFWEKNRPIPLLDEEMLDYHKKDSMEIAHRDPRYLDSLDRRRNRISVAGLLLTGQGFGNSVKRTSMNFEPLTQIISFNPAEGWVINPSFTWTKRMDTSQAGRRSFSITPNLRYGFANQHLAPYMSIVYSFGKKYLQTLRVSGGKRVFQFNNNSPIGERGNTISSLWGENNRIKSYEALYFRAGFRQGLGEGFTWDAGIQYQDRMPLDNKTDYTWRDKAGREYTPNYPHEIMTSNISRHQSFTAGLGIRWQPGTRYIELPDRKISIGSKYPVFSLQYIQGFPGVMGSDANFSKWKFNISDGINLRLLGRTRYRLGMGGFLNRDSIQVPDYNHFNGNLSTLATEYLNSFQLLPVYRFSNTAPFYSLAHIEHNFNGFLTNKLPGIRNLNLYLVTGMNGFYIDRTRNYFEWFAGIDNIFKQLRVDYVQSYIGGRPVHSAIRIGLRNSSPRRDDWP